MNKKELVEVLAKELDLPKSKCEEMISVTCDTIKKQVKKGNEVKLPGFGSFAPKKNAARNGINPATKEKIKIKASKSVKFKPSKVFKDLLN